jgi:probable O-sialoglycoprotein endopeptidase
LTDLCEQAGYEILFAPMKFCSDNAAMIARAAIEKLRKKEFTAPAELEIIPHLNLRSAFE